MTDRKILSGYKKTEIGIIPEDWEVKKLGEIFNITRGYVLPLEEMSKNKIGKYKYPVYSSQTQNNGVVGYYDKFLYENAITWTTDGANAGEVRFRKGKFYCTNVCGVLLSNKGYANPCIAGIFGMVSKKYVSYVGNPKLMNNVVKDIEIAIPPTLEEQRAIAQVLSDMDSLIESIGKLIEKKKLIKKGAMQELLTGKKRLPGFTGEWKVKKLGKIAQIYQPETISQDEFTNWGYNVFGANGLIGQFYRYNHEKWQTIVTCRGSTSGTVSKTTDKCWITGNAMVINVDSNPQIYKLFLFYLLSNQDFKALVTGSGQPQITRRPLYEYEIFYPKNVEEQRAIAQILSDMDAEIEALEKKKQKYEQIKQGAMQLLLTGRVRLKNYNINEMTR